MQEMQVRSLGWEDPREAEMATHSYILAREKSHEQRCLAGYRVAKSWTGLKRLSTHITVI